MSALPPIADIHRLVPELLLQQKQHAHGFYTRGPFSLLMCGSNYFSVARDRERTHTPDDPDSSYTCHKPLHRPLRHLRLRPKSSIRSIRQPDDCRKTPVGYLQSATKANDADKTSDGGLVARGSLAILLTIRRASSLLSSERNRSKRILI